MKSLEKAAAVAIMCACVLASALAKPAGAEEDWSRIYLGSNPSVSGDGRTFVFEWNDGIWLADTAGGEARRLGTDTYTDTWPALNKDGRRVAFASNRDGGTKVFVMDIKTGETVQATRNTEKTLPREWHPDGERVFCIAHRDTSGPRDMNRIVLVHTTSPDVEEMPFNAPALDPDPSPDGKSMLFVWRGDDLYRKRPNSTSPSAGQIWKFTFKTREFTPVLTHVTECRNPKWMPDGSGFYYLDAKGGVRNVWHYDFASGKERQMTFFKDQHVFQPTISADGHTLLFRQAFDFWRMDPTKKDAKPERILLHPAPGSMDSAKYRRRSYGACWNNDEDGDATFCDSGRQIAFTTGGDLFVMDSVVREPKLVHGDTLTQERSCVFSHDGRALYYVSDRGDGSDLIKAEPGDVTKPWWENVAFRKTKVCSDDQRRNRLSMSPDGRLLAWQDDNGIFTFATTNGTVVSRGPAASGGGPYAWSPDGKWVAAQLADENGNAEVWIVSTEAAREPYNLSRSYKFDGEPAWSPDGCIIAFISARPESNDNYYLRYVYLDKMVEDAEKSFQEIDESRTKIRDAASDTNRYSDLKIPGKCLASASRRGIDWTDLSERVRTTSIRARDPFFKFDSRTLAYRADSKRTDYIHIPDKMSGTRLFGCSGVANSWIKAKDGGDRVLWMVDNVPSHGESVLKFSAIQTTEIADYYELAFRTAWARIRDKFYDPGTHGADWNAVRDRYLQPARNARSLSVFSRVLYMMLGELDASHLDFFHDNHSRKEWGRSSPRGGWTSVTAHTGLHFAPGKGGWIVKDVIPEGPADRPGVGIHPGDLITAVDGVAVSGKEDPAMLLNGLENRNIRLDFRHQNGTNAMALVKSCSYEKAREFIGKAAVKETRRRVHKASDGKFGYLHVREMDWSCYWSFQRDVFSEGYGRDGLVIDVRGNTGGFTADRMLQILNGGDHSRTVSRNNGDGYLFGYWGIPVWNKPIVVLCDERAFSNGEIFSHAIKTMKRGKLVGRETGGGVIATANRPLLDLGVFRDAYRGWFLLDGTDMEHHGAKPDYEVDLTPADADAGRDPQLDKAIEVLGQELKDWRKAHPQVKFRYAR